jgi:hypothetical protein
MESRGMPEARNREKVGKILGKKFEAGARQEAI